MDAAHPKALTPWKRALAGRDSRELLELAARLEKLEGDPAYTELMELIKLGRESVMDSLVNEAILDQATYARSLGYVAGLDELLTVSQAIRETAARREEDLEAQAAGDADARAERG